MPDAHPHLSAEQEAVMRQAVNALDTAHGCLQLAAEGIRITDLPACQREVDDARKAVARALGWA